MDRGTRVTRRQFIATAGAAAAAAWSAQAASASRIAGANDALNVGVIGLGARGAELLADLHRRADIRVAAVCDIFEPRKDAAQALTGARVFHNWQDLVHSAGLDAVVVATPDHWHAPMTLAAFDAGLDVYCERPMALSAEDALDVRNKAAQTGRILQIGIQETSEGQWHAAHEQIRVHGKLGTVRWGQGRYGRCRCSRGAGPAGEITPRTLDWRAFTGPDSDREFDAARFCAWHRYWDYSCGDVAGGLYAQLAPLLLALGPELPERVSAAGGVHEDDAHEVPDALVMTAVYPSGHTLVLASTADSFRRDLPAVVHGAEATLYAEGDRLRIVDEEAGEEEGEVLPVEPRPDHVSDWLDAVRNRRKPACGVELAYATTVAVAMGIRAYRESTTV